MNSLEESSYHHNHLLHEYEGIGRASHYRPLDGVFPHRKKAPDNGGPTQQLTNRLKSLVQDDTKPLTLEIYFTSLLFRMVP